MLNISQRQPFTFLPYFKKQDLIYHHLVTFSQDRVITPSPIKNGVAAVLISNYDVR
jgi:hypothetical protein